MIIGITYFVFMGIDFYNKSKTPYDIQIAKSITVQLENGALVTLKGYALLDVDKEFETNENVYIELADNCLPSSLRHDCDVHEENGQMYAETKCCGSYPADLIPGKVIAIN